MKKLVSFSLGLAIVVIILGAYTRLTDAGLGCPDWPGCYGHLLVPSSDAHVEAANAAYPERPVESFKAWNEMVHRYFAGTLGLCILAISILAWRQRDRMSMRLPMVLLGAVCFQAMLGMWTVTLNLLPVVVMGHLLGGFTVLSCLFLLYLKLQPSDSPIEQLKAKSLLPVAAIGVAVLVGQIALGGWTSANYAALACTEFPVCEGDWSARLDFSGAFSVPQAENYEFGAHSYPERMTMHIVHRFGAVITACYLVWLAVRLYIGGSHSPFMRKAGLTLAAVLSAQILLGVSNIVFSLPLAVAVAHNAVAACLLLVMVWILFRLRQDLGGQYE